MTRLRFSLAALGAAAALAGRPGGRIRHGSPVAEPMSAANAAGGFHLAASSFSVNQDVGEATITIERGYTRHEAQIRYMTLPGTAVRRLDYTAVKAMIDFLPGQSQATFTIPIVNHGMVEVPKTVRIMLFGAHSTAAGRSVRGDADDPAGQRRGRAARSRQPARPGRRLRRPTTR